MANILSQLRKTFPEATVEVSTFDSFVRALSLEPTAMDALPTSTLEVGDTWIWGYVCVRFTIVRFLGYRVIICCTSCLLSVPGRPMCVAAWRRTP